MILGNFVHSRLRIALVGATFVLGFLNALPARADDAKLPERAATITKEKTTLRASFGYRDAIDTKIQGKLTSGLPTVIAMRAYLLRTGEDAPIALAVRSCRVVYDLWDEVFRVHLEAPGVVRDTAAVNVEGVLRICAEAKEMPVADSGSLAAEKSYFLAVLVEVNPVKPETVEQMRRWVSRPAGSTSIGPGDALFGSFAGLFLRDLTTADRILRFRTPAFKP